MPFQFDIPTFVRRLTPPLLRKSRQLAWIKALLQPVDYVIDQLNDYVTDVSYRVRLNSQVLILEMALNDEFDDSLRRIYITTSTGFYDREIYTYYTDEGQPDTFLKNTSEAPIASEIYLYSTQEQQDYVVATAFFTVHVPNSLTSVEDRLKSLINRYKLAGKTYTINYY